jgi:hypothetical protein
MAGMPPAKTGKCAKAALNTTLEQALKAPKVRKSLADSGNAPGGCEGMFGLTQRSVKKEQAELNHGFVSIA